MLSTFFSNIYKSGGYIAFRSYKGRLNFKFGPQIAEKLMSSTFKKFGVWLSRLKLMGLTGGRLKRYANRGCSSDF